MARHVGRSGGESATDRETMAHIPRTPPPKLWSPTRRQLIGGALATGFLAACGGDSGSDSASTQGPAATTGATSIDGSSVEPGTWTLVQRFPQNVQIPGDIRLPFSLSTGAAEFIDDGPEVLGAQVVTLDGEPIGDRITATLRVISPASYYSFRTTIEEPGFYSLVVDGGPEDGASFDVAEPADVVVPKPGEALEPFDTPTVEAPQGLEPICTREPICPFHEQTLTAALGSGKSVAYYIGSPAFCSTGTCAPGLESIIGIAEEYADRVEFVHAEVYTDLTATTVAPAVDALGLFYEPVLFVTDTDGVLVERLDAIFDVTELRESLDRALA